MCLFNAFMYCKIITTIVLAKTCIKLLNYRFFSVVRTFKIFLSNFQVYNIVLLTIVTMMCIISVEKMPILITLIFKIKMMSDTKFKGIFRDRNKNIEYILMNFLNYILKENPLSKKYKIFCLIVVSLKNAIIF